MDPNKLNTARELKETNEITFDWYGVVEITFGYCLGISNCVLSKSNLLIQINTYID